MEPNTHSAPPSGWRPERLAGLAAEIDRLAAEDLDQLPDAALAQQLLALRQLADRPMAPTTRHG